MEVVESTDEFDDIQCKSEHEDASFEEEDKMFSPLTCELCTETFTIPREWVRHVQTHTDMLPAKRRRRDSTGGSVSNSLYFYFWIRFIQGVPLMHKVLNKSYIEVILS